MGENRDDRRPFSPLTIAVACNTCNHTQFSHVQAYVKDEKCGEGTRENNRGDVVRTCLWWDERYVQGDLFVGVCVGLCAGQIHTKRQPDDRIAVVLIVKRRKRMKRRRRMSRESERDGDKEREDVKKNANACVMLL